MQIVFIEDNLHEMSVVFIEDNLHEMSKPISGDNKRNIIGLSSFDSA